MSSTLQVLTVCLPVAYLVAALLYAMGFGGDRAPRVVGARRVALAVALALHVAALGTRWEAAGGFPKLGTWTAISVVALFTALIFQAVSWNVEKKGIGGVLLGAVFALQLASSCFAPLATVGRDATLVFGLHVVTSTLAMSSVIVSGLLGVLYLILYRQMRRRSFGALFRHLPDLRTLARLTRRSALAGFLLLGVGVNVGIGWAHAKGQPGFAYTDPYVLVMLFLWVHFGLVAFSSRIPGITSARAAFAAAAGLVVFVLAFLMTLTSATFHLQG